MKKKNFDTWNFEEVEETFGLIRNRKDFKLLTEWLGHSYERSELQKLIMQSLRFQIQENADVWNEDELKFFFIGPLVAMVGYDIETYKGFTQRPLSQKFEELGIEAGGRVEFLLARGRQNPKQPFFFASTNTNRKTAATTTRSASFWSPCWSRRPRTRKTSPFMAAM